MSLMFLKTRTGYSPEYGYYLEEEECCEDCGAPLHEPDPFCTGECSFQMEAPSCNERVVVSEDIPF